MGNKLDLGTSFGDPNLVLQFRLLTPLFISFFICISWFLFTIKDYSWKSMRYYRMGFNQLRSKLDHIS